MWLQEEAHETASIFSYGKCSFSLTVPLQLFWKDFPFPLVLGLKTNKQASKTNQREAANRQINKNPIMNNIEDK